MNPDAVFRFRLTKKQKAQMEALFAEKGSACMICIAQVSPADMEGFATHPSQVRNSDHLGVWCKMYRDGEADKVVAFFEAMNGKQ